MKQKCAECGECEAKFEDPRDPVLDYEACLCRGCAIAAYNDEIANAEEAIRALYQQADRAGLKLAKGETQGAEE